MRDQNGLSKGSGFVAFSTREEAAQAVSSVPRYCINYLMLQTATKKKQTI